jgi:hypothetical protein
MIVVAHIAGVPVEELLSFVPALGVSLLALRSLLSPVDGSSGIRRRIGSDR